MIRNEHENLVLESVEVSSHDKLWEENMRNPFIRQLKEGKTLAEALVQLPGFDESFRALDTIDCSDGRVLGGRKVGLAGSGLLLSKEDRETFINANKGKIKTVTSHEDCGAAKLAFSNLTEKPAGLSADEYGRQQAEAFARALGAEHHYLPMSEMAEEHHNEAGIVIDGTGEFDSTNLDSFPPHFVCTAAGFNLSDNYVLQEASILTGIAFGDHGFGDLITAEDPFRLMIIAKDKDQADSLLKLVEPIVSKYDGRVKAETALRPRL